MKISTKGRYALRMMIDIGLNQQKTFLPLKQIAADIQVNTKYLEQIAATLTKAGLLQVMRGSSGGYRLCKAPEEYTVLEILEAAEGSVAPVACLEGGQKGCENAARCTSLCFWNEFYDVIQSFLGSKSLKDLLDQQAEKE